MQNFHLLETMRSLPGGSVYLLDRHLARIGASAQALRFFFDQEGVRFAILEKAAQHPAHVLRLLLAADGAADVEARPLPTTQYTCLRIAPVDSADAMLRHKTTARAVYENARAGFDAATDALLRNERGEFTETTITNIAVLRGGVWVTPPLECGLLPGTLRAELLEQGEIVEGVITDIAPGETVRCFNAVRGVYDAILTP